MIQEYDFCNFVINIYVQASTDHLSMLLFYKRHYHIYISLNFYHLMSIILFKYYSKIWYKIFLLNSIIRMCHNLFNQSNLKKIFKLFLDFVFTNSPVLSTVVYVCVCVCIYWVNGSVIILTDSVTHGIQGCSIHWINVNL